jgi:hypothetical protein
MREKGGIKFEPCIFEIVHLVLCAAEAKLGLPSRLQAGRQRLVWERLSLAYALCVMR